MYEAIVGDKMADWVKRQPAEFGRQRRRLTAPEGGRRPELRSLAAFGHISGTSAGIDGITRLQEVARTGTGT